jgi:uncharacterized ferredoxin-like protein
MLVSARTAPKGRGRDSVLTAIVTGEEKQKLSNTMTEKGSRRDALSIDASGPVVLIGVNTPEDLPDWERDMKLMDLGIATGSAVKTAMIHNTDNRIMLSAGRIAKALGFMKADHVLAIPLAASGKNVFFDRSGVYTRKDPDGYSYGYLEDYEKK